MPERRKRKDRKKKKGLRVQRRESPHTKGKPILERRRVVVATLLRIAWGGGGRKNQSHQGREMDERPFNRSIRATREREGVGRKADFRYSQRAVATRESALHSSRWCTRGVDPCSKGEGGGGEDRMKRRMASFTFLSGERKKPPLRHAEGEKLGRS